MLCAKGRSGCLLLYRDILAHRFLIVKAFFKVFSSFFMVFIRQFPASVCFFQQNISLFFVHVYSYLLERSDADMSAHHKNTFLGRRYFSVLTLTFVIGIYFALRFPISKVFFTDFLQISLLLLGALFLLCSLAGLMTRSFSGFFLIWFM